MATSGALGSCQSGAASSGGWGGALALAPGELRLRRRAMGLSQASLGRTLGVTANTLARWERGQQRLANPRLVQLALERVELARRAEQAVCDDRRRRARSSDAHNLPPASTSFVGRHREQRVLRQLVCAERLVTVVGPAGTGKTRLVLEVAHDLVGRFSNGAWLVELAALEDPSLLVRTVAAALPVGDQPGHQTLEALVQGLAGQQLLLVLDNCEHLASACATLVDRLLRTCPQVRVIATSRAVLGVAGEVPWRLPPLSVPGLHCSTAPGHLHRSEAVGLFLERARSAQPGFALTPTNAESVAEIEPGPE